MASWSSKRAKSRCSSASSGRPAGPLAAHPALEHGRARLLLRVGEQVEQDRQLGPVVEVAADDLERVGVEHDEQLVVVQPQQLLEAGGAQNHWFSPAVIAGIGPYRQMRG